MNPIERILRLAENDAAIKLVFDHVRNLALCSLLLTLGTYILARPEGYGPPILWAVVGAVVQLSAGALTFLNALHGLKKALAIRNPIARGVVYVAAGIVGPVTVALVYTIRPLSGS